LLEESNLELKRLGWTQQQGKDYLIQAYGKQSRQHLTDAQMSEFVTYLKAQPMS
jgi:hypothetical protein